MAQTAEGDPAKGIVTDPWVAQTLGEQLLINGGFLEDDKPSLHLVLTNDAAPNLCYYKQSRNWGERVGARIVTHRYADDFEAARVIEQELGPDPTVNGILAYLPSWTDEGQTAIRKAMPPEKDVDGVTLQGEQPLLVPATAEAMRIVAENISGRSLKEMGKIGLVGYGARTLRPLHERIMRSEAVGVEPTVIFDGRKQLEALKDEGEGVEALLNCDVIFTAAPNGILLTPDRVREGQLIIDVGTGGVNPENDNPCGNVDPAVFSMQGIVQATAFRRGVGPITTAITQGRAIDHRLAQVGLSRDQIVDTLPFAEYLGKR